jgi:two-component system chemotaxis response regulator CheV
LNTGYDKYTQNEAIMKNKDGILLESGSNELEVVTFRLDELNPAGETVPCNFGVNVAKVREIIRLPHIFKVANTHPAIVGMIKLRGRVVTVIDLASVLEKNVKGLKADHVVVLEFNNLVLGVIVQKVSRIYRISWKEVEPPVKFGESSYVTGLVKKEDFIIFLLDFEKIIGEICSEDIVHSVGQDLIEHAGKPFDRSTKKILVVDDSPFIRQALGSTLRKAGYVVEEAGNGEEAWLAINNKLDYCRSSAGNMGDELNLIITDVEMPQMDGLHLTAKVKGEPSLQGIPLVIFSSLATEDNIRKWRNLGADNILTKPDLPNLVRVADTLVQGGTA